MGQPHRGSKYREEVIRLRQSGLSAKQTALKLGIAREYVVRLSKGAEYKRNPGGCPRTLDYEAVLDRLSRGEKPSDIARLYGVTRAAIHRVKSRSA